MMRHPRMLRNEINDLGTTSRGSIELSRNAPGREWQRSAHQFVKSGLVLDHGRTSPGESPKERLFVPAHNESLPLRERLRRDAPAPPSNRGNDAEGTIGIAAILDLHDSAVRPPEPRCEAGFNSRSRKISLQKISACHDRLQVRARQPVPYGNYRRHSGLAAARPVPRARAARNSQSQ